jgi:hypothetical protein
MLGNLIVALVYIAIICVIAYGLLAVLGALGAPIPPVVASSLRSS